MHILWIDPFHGGSHAAVSRGYATHSQHQVSLLTLPIDGGWRWRMRGAAVTLARMYRESGLQPDLIVTTDMLDVASFRSLAGLDNMPIVVYFHENQLTYPLPEGRSRDLSFAWTNYTSALSADLVCFNSHFHQNVFLEALPSLLLRYHDYQERETIDLIASKVHVLAPGVALKRLDRSEPLARLSKEPILLWNSRWEYDKQPEAFFTALEEVDARGIDFKLIVAGEHIDPNAPAFVAARERWAKHILHWGYAPSSEMYRDLLHQADIVVSSAIQEFFGISIIEALYCGCIPVLPKRLTYPSLLPEVYHQTCLYRSPQELVERLCATMERVDELRQIDWKGVAEVYDWSQMAPLYDACFEQMQRRRLWS